MAATTNKGFGLLFEMGCGKTRTAIAIAGAAYQKGAIQRVLVIAPTSVVSVWPKEIAEVADFKVTCKALLGTKQQRIRMIEDLQAFPFKALKVAVINYESTWRDGLFEKLQEYDADLIICDEIKLKDLLLDLDLNDYDLTATGFSSKEVEDLVIRLDKDVEAEDDNFDADADYESIEEPVTQRGDIWILGDHRLMCGDSTDLGDVNTLMGGEEADLVITDPPYNVNYKDGSIKNDNMDEGSFEDFLQNAFLAMFENMRSGAAAYIFHADSEGLAFRRAFRDAGFKMAECLIWEKNSFVLGRQDYQWRHEPILYGWKEGAAHYFIDDRSQDTILLEDELDLESMKKEDLITYINQIIAQYKDQTTVLFEKKPTKNDVHPTMKPVNLVGRLMRNSSKPGWNVLDLFGGSGSTLMAAEQIGRRAFLMELDEKFCDVIVHRWEEFTGKKAVRAGKLEVSL